MRTLLGTKRLSRRQRVVEIVTDQLHLDRIAAEHPRFLHLLLRRRHRHENHATHAEMAAHERHALRVVSRRGADKNRLAGNDLAHGIERAAQLVGPHGAQVFALQPDVGVIARRQQVVAQQRGRRENAAHFGGGSLCIIFERHGSPFRSIQP